MSNLISREAALALAKDIVVGEYRHRCIDPDCIRELPTIDAVPVVRCKDCKHKRRYKFPPKYDEKDYCEKHEKVVSETCFCSWGERRTDE